MYFSRSARVEREAKKCETHRERERVTPNDGDCKRIPQLLITLESEAFVLAFKANLVMRKNLRSGERKHSQQRPEETREKRGEKRRGERRVSGAPVTVAPLLLASCFFSLCLSLSLSPCLHLKKQSQVNSC